MFAVDSNRTIREMGWCNRVIYLQMRINVIMKRWRNLIVAEWDKNTIFWFKSRGSSAQTLSELEWVREMIAPSLHFPHSLFPELVRECANWRESFLELNMELNISRTQVISHWATELAATERCDCPSNNRRFMRRQELYPREGGGRRRGAKGETSVFLSLFPPVLSLSLADERWLWE